MEKSNLYALIEPLKSKFEIEKLFDLIESKRQNLESFKAFIKDIERVNFNIYNKVNDTPERIKFNESLFDFYINEKLKATQRKYNNYFDFNDNLVYYLERLAKVLSESEYGIYSKEISINEKIIRELSEYLKTKYCEKVIENQLESENSNNSIIFNSEQKEIFEILNKYYQTKKRAKKQKYQFIYQYLVSYYEFGDKKRYESLVSETQNFDFKLKTSIAGVTKENAFNEMKKLLIENNVKPKH